MPIRGDRVIPRSLAPSLPTPLPAGWIRNAHIARTKIVIVATETRGEGSQTEEGRKGGWQAGRQAGGRAGGLGGGGLASFR